MKPLRVKLQEKCFLKKSPLDIIEKDYALSYLLAGIAQKNELTHSLIFKGGTALKKIFFGDYRFSVDLDFSTLNAPKNQALEKALHDSVNRPRSGKRFNCSSKAVRFVPIFNLFKGLQSC